MKRRLIVASLAFSAGAAALNPTGFMVAQAWADRGISTETRPALTTIARLMYPHADIPDSVYADALDQAMANVADDFKFAQLFDAASQSLDRSSPGRFQEATPREQLAALKTIEEEPFFTLILGAIANGFYAHRETWPMLGYDGPSFGFGGWLDRGSDDIDWLPEESV